MFRDYLVNRLHLQRINLKRPLSRGNRFKIYFRLECRENRGLRQNFHEIPFLGDCKIITSGHMIISYLLLTHAIYIKAPNLTQT